MTSILIAAPVRERPHILREYVNGLNGLDTDGLEVSCFFVLNGENRDEARAILDGLRYPTEFYEWDDAGAYNRDEETHRWTRDNLSNVAAMKNLIIERACGPIRPIDMIAGVASTKTGVQVITLSAPDKLRPSHLFLVDSDLVLHPKTLRQLVAANMPIIAEVYWTRWNPGLPPQPNAWDLDFYTFIVDKQGDEPGAKYRVPGLYKVGGTGACILIRRDVLEAGIRYEPIDNVSWSQWEDRAFCVRAAVHGFGIWLDTHYPATHLYRESEYEAYMRGKTDGKQSVSWVPAPRPVQMAG